MGINQEFAADVTSCHVEKISKSRAFRNSLNKIMFDQRLHRPQERYHSSKLLKLQYLYMEPPTHTTSNLLWSWMEVKQSLKDCGLVGSTVNLKLISHKIKQTAPKTKAKNYNSKTTMSLQGKNIIITGAMSGFGVPIVTVFSTGRRSIGIHWRASC
jgi:N-acetylmuramoyl-L-alanine amidase CwlA